ncbi:hypothetical protein T09_6952, partial [Trichinella sp. T9]
LAISCWRYRHRFAQRLDFSPVGSQLFSGSPTSGKSTYARPVNSWNGL